jgi:phosphatidylinositol glycan class F
MPLIDPVTMSGMSGASQSRSSRSSMPIELLPTSIAGSNYASPLLLLTALYLRFPALVADPVPTLLQALVPVALCQTTYCLYCLPVAGTNSRVARKAQKSKGGTAKKPNDGLLLAAKASVRTFQSLFKPYLKNANQNT